MVLGSGVDTRMTPLHNPFQMIRSHQAPPDHAPPRGHRAIDSALGRKSLRASPEDGKPRLRRSPARRTLNGAASAKLGSRIQLKSDAPPTRTLIDRASTADARARAHWKV